MNAPSHNINQMQSFARELIFILFYRKRLIKTVVITLAILVVLLACVLPSKYKAQAKFMVTIPDQMDPLRKEIYTDSKNKTMRFLLDQKELIYSNKVLNVVAAEMYPGLDPEKYSKIIETLRKDIDVEPPKGESFEGSNVFFLSYQDASPERALSVTQAIARTYENVFANLSKSKSEYSYEFFKDQTEQLLRVMEEKSSKIKDYETENALAMIDILNLESGKTNIEVGPKALLTEALRKREALNDEFTSLRRVIDEMDSDMAANNIPTIMPEMEGAGKAVTVYKNKVAQLQLQIAEMKTLYTGDYEPLRQSKAELDSNINLLRDEIQRYLKSRKIQAASLQSSIEENERNIGRLEELIKDTAQRRANYEAIKQDHKLAVDAYSDAKGKLEQARQAASLNQEKQNISQIDPPELPHQPFKPNRILLVVLGLLASIFVGVASALVADYFDHTLKTPEDIERYLDSPFLGSLPRVGL